MSEFDFEDLQTIKIPRQAIHFRWANLSNLAEMLLNRILKRGIPVDVVRSDYYDWTISLSDDYSLTLDELETLFSIIDANDWDRESNEFDGHPIQELSQSLSRKLVSLLLPFKAHHAHADDEGVWFMSELIEPKACVKPVMPDEMPVDGETLFKLISEGVASERQAYKDDIYRKGAKKLWTHLYRSNIYKEVAGMVEDDLKNHFNPEYDSSELQIIYGLVKKGVFLKTISEWAYEMENLDIATYGAIAELIQDYCNDVLKSDE